MAFQVGTACYPTATAAAQATAAAVVPTAFENVVISVAAVTDSTITYLYTPVGNAAISPYTVVQPILLQPCNQLSAEDALYVGWVIAGAWLAIYGIQILARMFRGETGDNYGRES